MNDLPRTTHQVDRNDVRARVQSYLTVNFLVDFKGDVTEDTNLFATGLLDSFAFVQLVGYIESEFKVKVTDEDVTSDALTSLGKIAQFITEKAHG